MRLLFLGDSLIEYFDWQERFPNHNVWNLGMAGESVEGLLSRVVRVKQVCPEADMIFIMSGINNVAMGDPEFIESYRVILEELSSAYPDAKKCINSLLPVLLDYISNESVFHVNESLKKLAEDMGAEYLDIYSRFVDTKGRPIREYLLVDGVHLSGTGYDVWSNAVEQVIDGQRD